MQIHSAGKTVSLLPLTLVSTITDGHVFSLFVLALAILDHVRLTVDGKPRRIKEVAQISHQKDGFVVSSLQKPEVGETTHVHKTTCTPKFDVLLNKASLLSGRPRGLS